MRSRIVQGRTRHCRVHPRRHEFSYAMFWLRIDLAELGKLDRRIRWFGHNRRALVSIRDRDYAGPQQGSIEVKIRSRLEEAGIDGIERIDLITIPRVAGYVFNPVSFYMCRDRRGSLRAVIAEVHNTFEETHHYVVRPETAGDGRHRFSVPKRFYVSPFLDVSGVYHVSLLDEPDRFEIEISLREDGHAVLHAGMSGEGAPLTSRRLLATLLRHPLFAAMIMVRIHAQALRLMIKRIRPSDKPAPHPSTIAPRSRSLMSRLRLILVRWASQRGTTCTQRH